MLLLCPPHPLFQGVRLCGGKGRIREVLPGSSPYLPVTCVDWNPGGGCGEAEGRLEQDWTGGEGSWSALLPAPTLVCMDAGAEQAEPWQQVRGPGKAPWRGRACSFSTAQWPSASCCQLCFPRGRDWVFSWQRRACWEGKTACQLRGGAGGLGRLSSGRLRAHPPLPPEPVTVRRRGAARSPAGGSTSRRPQPAA